MQSSSSTPSLRSLLRRENSANSSTQPEHEGLQSGGDGRRVCNEDVVGGGDGGDEEVGIGGQQETLLIPVTDAVEEMIVAEGSRRRHAGGRTRDRDRTKDAATPSSSPGVGPIARRGSGPPMRQPDLGSLPPRQHTSSSHVGHRTPTHVRSSTGRHPLADSARTPTTPATTAPSSPSSATPTTSSSATTTPHSPQLRSSAPASSASALHDAVSMVEQWPRRETIPTTFTAFLADEALGFYAPPLSAKLSTERVGDFVAVPLALEQLLAVGSLIALDAFLFTVTFLPLRVGLALYRGIGCLSGARKSLPLTAIADLCRGGIVAITMWAMMRIDPSFVYHLIRGQSTIKLYVIFNLFEILDKLCRAFGFDVFESLYYAACVGGSAVGGIAGIGSSGTDLPARVASLIRRYKYVQFVVACVCCITHACVKLVLFVSLNAAVNSHTMTLATLMISNQFMELKKCVQKRYDTKSLFIVTCGDIIERFQLVVFVALILLKNSGSLLGTLSMEDPFVQAMLMSCAGIVAAEVAVDWLKHAFITSFSGLKPSFYSSMEREMKQDLFDAASYQADESFGVCRHIGFVPLPLTCLVVRVVIQVMPLFSDYYEIAWPFIVLGLYAVSLAAKLAVKWTLWKLCERQRRERDLKAARDEAGGSPDAPAQFTQLQRATGALRPSSPPFAKDEEVAMRLGDESEDKKSR